MAIRKSGGRAAKLLALGAGLCCWACSAASGPSSARAGRGVGSGDSVTNPHVVAAAGAGSAPILSAPAAVSDGSGTPPANCGPGTYVGNYACKLVMQGTPTDTPIEGVVSFDLEVNAQGPATECPPGVEFCDFDLVIKEGSGKLFGFVLGIVGFETGLKGGLDCSTGKFHADAVGGIYGVPWEDPADPTKLKVSLELGTFDGTLDGVHQGMIPQVIAGEWNLGEPSLDIYCPGPFSVEQMP
jgi:hypothetical protein